MDINITRWTTDEGRDALFGALVENEQPALVEALRNLKDRVVDCPGR
jgi:hypothetical protein